MKTPKQKILRFHAPEYLYHEKSALWYVAAGLVLLLLVLYGLKTEAWSFSVALLVFAGTYVLFQEKRPAILPVEISNFAVTIGPHTFPFGQLKSFWIVHKPPHVSRLYLQPLSRFTPHIFIQLTDAQASEVRAFLKEHLHEAAGRQEPFSDALARFLKL